MYMNIHFRAAVTIILVALMALPTLCCAAQSPGRISGFDLQAKRVAEQCRNEIVDQFNTLIDSGLLEMNQLFDTFYIPVPNTFPQRYRTRYDQVTEKVLRPILDRYLQKEKRFVFVVAVDRNGYLPTHNSKFSQELTGDREIDTQGNRAKRIFNDRTGLAAARNTKGYLLQHYRRDTGEELSDMSIPIYIQGQHWGAVRIAYK